MVTLFGGILFINENDNIVFIQLFALLFILLMNAYFVIKWLHLLLYAFKSQNKTLERMRKVQFGLYEVHHFV